MHARPSIASVLTLCEEPPTSAGTPLERARRMREALILGLRGLAAADRLALELHFCVGLEIEEISDLLGAPAETYDLGAAAPEAMAYIEEAHDG